MEHVEQHSKITALFTVPRGTDPELTWNAHAATCPISSRSTRLKPVGSLVRRKPRLDPRHEAFLFQVQAVEAVRRLQSTSKTSPCQLEMAQLALYERFRSELWAEVLRDGKLVTDDAEEILKRPLRLVQVASNPLLVDES